MEMKAYLCPACSAPLNVEEGATFTTCPNCGSKIQISYSEKEVNPNVQEFVTTDGVRVAKAILPEGYKLEAAIQPSWQSEMVPSVSYIRAESPNQDIILSSASKEMFHEPKSTSFKTILSLLQNHTKNGYVPFMDVEDYMNRYAEQMAGVPLTPIAKTNLPSPLGNNPELAHAALQSDIGLYDSYMGEQSHLVNAKCESVLYKYEGKMNDLDIVVLVGADYQGAELKYSIPGFGEIADVAGKALSGLKDAFSNLTGNDASLGGLKETISEALHGDSEGNGKMTFDDWMHGGLVGKMMRDKKAKQAKEPQVEKPVSTPQAEPTVNEEGEVAFGHGQHVDLISYGSQRRYACIALKDKEEEATKVFLRFIASIVPDENLAQRDLNAINQKISAMMMEAQRNQAMAQQMQMQTIQMQQQTSQMIARNSQQVSAGIMDSWNKRQAAQSRMSTNYSEAIRGVNSYVTPSGKTVEMSVVADHVYQNKYGDTIGISGTDIGQDVASKLDWTKLDKK